VQLKHHFAKPSEKKAPQKAEAIRRARKLAQESTARRDAISIA